MEEQKKLQLLLVGSCGSGKTCLAIRYSLSEFQPNDYIPTILENFKKKIVIDDTSVELSIWDSEDECDYPRLRPLIYIDKQIILLCFSINDRKTFDKAKNIFFDEMKEWAIDVPFILVGLKSDLREEFGLTLTECISFNEALLYSKEIRASNYIECSSMNGTNVNFLFETAAKIYLDGHKPNQSKNCVLVWSFLFLIKQILLQKQININIILFTNFNTSFQY
ncbi:ras-like GTP-binding protein Rho1 [Entamoeba marina]